MSGRDGDGRGTGEDRRPAIIALLAGALALGPLVQAAGLSGLRVLTAAPGRPWGFVAYGLAAPYVAALLWRRHPRARFAAYVFLTHEAIRGLHFGRPDAVVAALGGIALLQLPGARAYLPAVRPREVLARLGRVVRR